MVCIRLDGNLSAPYIYFSAKCMNAAFTMNGYGIRVLGTNSQLTTIGLACPLLLSIKRNVMSLNGNILTISQKSAAT